MAGSGHERRQHKRVPFIKEVKVHGVGIRRSSEISIGGMYIETMQSYPEGTLLDLQFKLHDTEENTINVQGQVLYNHPHLGIGVRFSNLKPEDLKKIEQFVEQTG